MHCTATGRGRCQPGFDWRPARLPVSLGLRARPLTAASLSVPVGAAAYAGDACGPGSQGAAAGPTCLNGARRAGPGVAAALVSPGLWCY